MANLDSYSYACGVIDAFNEIVKAGVKKLALSHPCGSRAERDALIPFAREICQRYGTRFYPEDHLLITDLFPFSANRGKPLLLFYREEETLRAYFDLKARKEALLGSDAYTGDARTEIAVAFGKLLSYEETAIRRMISENPEKE